MQVENGKWNKNETFLLLIILVSVNLFGRDSVSYNVNKLPYMFCFIFNFDTFYVI